MEEGEGYLKLRAPQNPSPKTSQSAEFPGPGAKLRCSHQAAGNWAVMVGSPGGRPSHQGNDEGMKPARTGEVSEGLQEQAKPSEETRGTRRGQKLGGPRAPSVQTPVRQL